jgi:hypothetical protein
MGRTLLPPPGSCGHRKLSKDGRHVPQDGGQADGLIRGVLTFRAACQRIALLIWCRREGV